MKTANAELKVEGDAEVSAGGEASAMPAHDAAVTITPTDAAASQLTLDAAVEEEVRRLLLEHFAPLYQERVENYVSTLLALDSYVGRFEYLRSITGPALFRPDAKILISGCGPGSEMLMARKFGFAQIYGVEVEQFWIDACRRRLAYFPDMHAAHYDGEFLPYHDEMFDVIASGHVIEHTADPDQYLRECLRVMRTGGYLSLEFPNRYHRTELHTNLPSFEWLPRRLRNAVIGALTSRLAPLKADVKTRYSAITLTHLQQISMPGVRRRLKRTGHRFAILHSVRPLPGVTRCVIRKD
jgi:SAM-dependent methyltransferase